MDLHLEETTEELLLDDKCSIHEEKIEDFVKKTYSNPSSSMVEFLNETRQKPFLKRVFRSLGPGSLRGTILNFVRLTTGIGILALPYYLSKLGMMVGVIIIIIAGFLTYNAFIFYLEAQIESKEKKIFDVVRHFMPNWLVSIFKVTLCVDLVSPPIIYIVVGWNIFNFLLYSFGKLKDEWIIDADKLEFHQYAPLLFVIRIIFLNAVFLVTTPLFVKKSLEKLKILSQVFLLSFFLLIVIIFVQAYFFYEKYNDPEDPANQTQVYLFKDLKNFSSIIYCFSILLAFYGQPYIMTIRNQLLQPSLKRLKKVTRVNIGINYVIYITFAVVGYGVWGDKFTPTLLILRKPVEMATGLELIYKIILILFLILMFIGIASFNPTLRDVCIEIFISKKGRVYTRLYRGEEEDIEKIE